MKKIFLSLLTVSAVSLVAVGATRAYFSSTAEIKENYIDTKYLEISWDGSRNIYGGGMNFPLEIAPGEDTNWEDPNGLTHDQRMRILIADGSMIPDHFEIKFATTNFVDGLDSGHGSASNRSQYTKVIEVTSLYNHTDGWSWHNLKNQIDDAQDGVLGFLSLYDLERSLIDNVAVGDTLNSIGFTMKMSDDAGNKFQGDSLDLEVTVGAAQVSGQPVL